jgi:hypothetical protein
MLKIISRYKTLRTFEKLSNNIIQFNAYDTIYNTVSYKELDSFEYGKIENDNNIISVDPDGGPIVYIGYKIKLDNDEIYKVKSFKNINYDKEKKYLNVKLRVIKEN